MAPRILVINPNSTRSITEGISRALEPLRLTAGPAVDCVTLAEGPPGIETDQHVRDVVDPICRLVREESPRTAAFVIACYSDPGLAPARESTPRPVFGIAESGMLSALARARRFGVISILEPAVARHLRYVESLGFSSRLAGDLPVGLGVLELADEARATGRLIEVGTRLRDEHHADVIVLGCAGMTPYRAHLEQTLGLPIVDPTFATVAMAIGAVVSPGVTPGAGWRPPAR